MKVEDKRQIIFRKKVVSWQYRTVSDFFFFLRVRRVKEDRYQKRPAAAHPWVASRRADPSHPRQPLASQPGCRGTDGLCPHSCPPSRATPAGDGKS